MSQAESTMKNEGDELSRMKEYLTKIRKNIE